MPARSLPLIDRLDGTPIGTQAWKTGHLQG
jgi:hypothetical protein